MIFEVLFMTNLDWRINIENLALRVAEKYGKQVAQSAFERFGATCIDNLDTSHYEDVFSDLMVIDSDD